MLHPNVIAHAKRKWDAELAEWHIMLEQLFTIQAQLKTQQERIHKAYVAYKRVSGDQT